jgi:hypothetical protein
MYYNYLVSYTVENHPYDGETMIGHIEYFIGYPWQDGTAADFQDYLANNNPADVRFDPSQVVINSVFYYGTSSS